MIKQNGLEVHRKDEEAANVVRCYTRNLFQKVGPTTVKQSSRIIFTASDT